ncbi:hypothetical protein L249_0862 [Ophiocordyceps polyrhachis-furcata BCC 54312]|uniref:Uncharacterized protein n=1 Tax=Ophiocordyceps polyrhachis-furcata BCC 54312 TaxID=1330021 RepID=A0A367LGH6_9HYPO|nr:hypothetical protein L249_0862 [Ophiocordyceps polyrhachis-furcata BCC 54312]
MQFKEIKRDIDTTPLLFPVLVNSTTFINAQADYSYNCYAAISESLSARDLVSAPRYPYS